MNSRIISLCFIILSYSVFSQNFTHEAHYGYDSLKKYFEEGIWYQPFEIENTTSEYEIELSFEKETTYILDNEAFQWIIESGKSLYMYGVHEELSSIDSLESVFLKELKQIGKIYTNKKMNKQVNENGENWRLWAAKKGKFLYFLTTLRINNGDSNFIEIAIEKQEK